jgi:ABC-type microcin C transport system permease subunit YejB
VVRFALRRVAQGGLTLFVIAIATFLLLRATPGGPAQVLLGPDRYTPELEARLNQQLGLDRPLPVQLARWLESLARGELGYSYFHRRPALDVVRERLPATVTLATVSWPTPGQAKTLSTITLPSIACGSDSPACVAIGIAALRSACPQSTRRSPTPFALAVRV